jgi:IQ calmodulin-binding motif
MLAAPVRGHRGHRSSLTQLDDIKNLQAELAKLQSEPRFTPRARLSNSASHILHKTSNLSHPLLFTAFASSSFQLRPHSSAGILPIAWNPLFLDKPAEYKRFLITHPDVYPVCALHLAAICIQRWWRGMERERRVRRSCRRLQSLPTWEHPWDRLKRIIVVESAGQKKKTQMMRGGSGGEGEVAVMGLTSPSTVSFADHCARVIQRAWRASRDRRHRLYARRRMYRVAARSIQRRWRQRIDTREQKRNKHSLAAVVIQRAFRRHAVSTQHE